MRILFKYFFWLLSLFSLVIYYFLNTSLGHLSLRYYIEDYYSKKMDNKIEILSLNIKNYPYIMAEIKINDKAHLSLRGIPDKNDMNLTYQLRGETFEWDDYILLEPFEVEGEMKGAFSELLISGEGEIFNGNIAYFFTRRPNRLENMEVTLQNVRSKPLLEFLSYKNILKGDIDVFMDFDYFTSYRRKGLVKVSMQEGIVPQVSEEIEVSLEAEIVVKDLLHEFFADIKSDIGKLRIGNGHYNRAANITTADYGLHIHELAYLDAFLKHRYQGSLNTAGSLNYDNGILSLDGDSDSYGGLLEYVYKNGYIDIDFRGVSLEQLLRQLSFPALLSSKVYGSASYNLKDEIILVNTALKETRFRRTQMTDKIYDLTDIDVLKDTYNDSIFTAAYQDNILISLLEIDNGVNHLYLKDTRMNSKTNEITANFEVQIDGQQFVGNVYGTLENPEVNLDMSKLIKYQINKKIENFFGAGKPLNRQNTEEALDGMQNEFSNQMKNFEMDRFERKTRSFLNGFFD
ncbi:MAG: Unknown protein [uncultured Sulfurovum sp.]|uniref:AsmA-like C-terminal domain-containing protein n=1 Tax=uncultured Sulfurovum sp. TaxID=269237 RepID=A0A6S6TAS6_9BACT|nr:MAG: Unknown protein [uncultured Sulfurovum sp.]